MPVKLKRCAGPCGQEKLLDEYWNDSKQPDGKQKRCIVCVKESRATRAERRRSGEELPVISEEERDRRSKQMVKLHEEGRAGPQYGHLGGRPRKPRLAEVLLETFREESDLLIKAVRSSLRSKNRGQQMRAVEFLSRLEQDDEKRMRDARGAGKDPADMDPAELEEFVTQGLLAAIARGDLNPGDIITLGDEAVSEAPVRTAA